MSDIRVLVVEDEPVAAAAHGAYVGRLPGFSLAGTAPDGQSALRLLTEFAAAGKPVELVLLDMNLPDLHGLDIARRMRASGLLADIIAITAVRELTIVRSAVSIGVVQYLIKPFTYASFADKLTSYRQFRDQLAAGSGGTKSGASQSDVDQAFASLRAPTELPLPKGLSTSTLDAVQEFMKQQADAVSATEVMDALGMSRVTARRYLEYLADAGTVSRTARYGAPGRPENEYRWSRS
ncbi:response regulator [Arthrobacter sp. ISL-72]|uniref:response regulator n=1 Tax=Arthrobacter sp. ISL-72 TaxID=2819114 RepID=UPI001BE7EADE|nr:response regulator [Arthrobacter sp. ISL-72]MBT2597765.1 response regulator [Arthrobacter sp. ISL-72]